MFLYFTFWEGEEYSYIILRSCTITCLSSSVPICLISQLHSGTSYSSGDTNEMFRYQPPYMRSGGSGGGGPGGPDPPKAAIYFNIKLLIHVQGPVIKCGWTPLSPNSRSAPVCNIPKAKSCGLELTVRY